MVFWPRGMCARNLWLQIIENLPPNIDRMVGVNCRGLKEVQLGMKLGTASHRLRVKIMFWLAGELGLLNCIRCGEKIDSEADFSIDHKEPWLHLDTSSFWDMKNIGFSHKNCNYTSRRKNPDRTKQAESLRHNDGPDGTAWCGGHRQYLPIDQFHKHNSKWNGLQSDCRECRSKARSPKKHGITEAMPADTDCMRPVKPLPLAGVWVRIPGSPPNSSPSSPTAEAAASKPVQ